MPAFLGQDFNVAGIKWIASFPDNINKGIPRANSVVVLNNADTGQPMAVINTGLLSIIRTACVSGLVMKKFDEVRGLKDFTLGIIGFGPIGQYHLKMCNELFGDKISKIYLYDLRPIDKNIIDPSYREKVEVVNSWQESYDDSDVFITCTVSKASYIDREPKEGALLLNVSLRDFKVDIFDYVGKNIIVDDWEEVCRENTDIENIHKEKGLTKEDTKSIVDVVCNECLKDYNKNEALMFNPMGMAVFDMAVGSYYYNKAIELNKGVVLE
jgi:ornithine cyclodeaminase